MGALGFMIPVMLLFAVILIACFTWALKAEQFEDLETQKYRIFFDDKAINFQETEPKR